MNYLKLLFLPLILSLVSCSSFVQRMHNQINNESGRPRIQKNRADQFARFRQNQNSYYNQLKQGPRRQLSTKQSKYYNPQVKRQYSRVKRRYKADDLVDGSNSGSLWTGSGQNAFLFSKNNYKRNGDIVIINVQDNLKREISAELARAFPNRPKKKDKKAGAEGDKAGGAGAATENRQPSNNEGSTGAEPSSPDKVFDRVSSVVVEEINKDHVLLRGRKDVLHKQRKRTVEVQALISRRDINDDDTIASTNVIESSVQVLR